MKKLMILGLVLFMGLALAPMVAAGTLWYNGDLDGSNAVVNDKNACMVHQAALYDDFQVPSGTQWTINTVWSNNIFSNETAVSQDSWEIRSGVSAGNDGTLEASGTGEATLSLTGRDFYGYPEYTVQVTGLNVSLGPETYWLNVSPITTYNDPDNFAYSNNSTTMGANAIGQPPGNKGMSFLNCQVWDYQFTSTKDIFNYDGDFSMGVAGNAVPVPSGVLLRGSGLLGVAGFAWSRRRQEPPAPETVRTIFCRASTAPPGAWGPA